MFQFEIQSFAYKDFDSFVEKHICPVLLPYSDGIWIKKCLENKIVTISVINQKSLHKRMATKEVQRSVTSMMSVNRRLPTH